ncbi:Crp/Fnr family transcriptional regulator [Chryseobacterium shigense]|uniref:cAMP-binding domain of CRP or a regulatory subunit of cAMP-dependent protein kinases n=1 Tax=Chryseobacterium shigense TaxID=297244 RepID=A0A1N7I4T1_9FLAO|nr:Crp/Fnr family transcriptional regulator [Chryseobacterium shigense]PQA95047.1 Crp/Fnr family transcriptional regulator [Chryseobacterium shigense]SIS31990.1 cAMP-binding domain of CRP or a regulatory subunit of cAMP-dependent protein kinases [Chryseobacterium shigense]
MIQKLLNSGLYWEEKEFKRNEFLKISGSTDTDIYFVDNGSVRIFMMDENEERIIRFGYTGNIIVSLDSFLSGKPSDFYIQAIKKTRVRIASKKDFYQFIQSNEENLKFWNRILEDLVLQQIEREKDLLISSPGERFSRVLKRSPKLFQEVPNKYIANYLRMSPETLSRLKKS